VPSDRDPTPEDFLRPGEKATTRGSVEVKFGQSGPTGGSINSGPRDASNRCFVINVATAIASLLALILALIALGESSQSSTSTNNRIENIEAQLTAPSVPNVILLPVTDNQTIDAPAGTTTTDWDILVIPGGMIGKAEDRSNDGNSALLAINSAAAVGKNPGQWQITLRYKFKSAAKLGIWGDEGLTGTAILVRRLAPK
jgi:hypothetical protein